MTTKEETIPEQLEALRAKGWSDKAIGEALDVDRTVVFRWRRGRNLGAQRIVSLALRALDRRKVPA